MNQLIVKDPVHVAARAQNCSRDRFGVRRQAKRDAALESTEPAHLTKAPSPRLLRLRDGALHGLAILVFVAWVAVGCKSTPETPSNRLASVIIKDRTSDEIEAAIKNVFEKHDFELGPRRDARVMVFEKKGSFMNGLVYGDWYSGGVWDRVKVYARELEPGRTLVDCDAFMVQEHDDPFFQSERAPYKTRRHVYQKLLEEVVKELNKER